MKKVTVLLLRYFCVTFNIVFVTFHIAIFDRCQSALSHEGDFYDKWIMALVANGKQELQETLDEWNGLFTRHGLKLRIEKTEVLHICHHREGRAEHRAGGEETVSGGQFRVSRRGSVWRWKYGESLRQKVHAEANAWRAVEGVMADRRISKRLKGKVMSTFVTPVSRCLHGTETLALTEIQQQRRQVCKKAGYEK